jgi:hypothetical protein
MYDISYAYFQLLLGVVAILIVWDWAFLDCRQLEQAVAFAFLMPCAYTRCSWSLHWKESSVKLEMSCTMRYLLFNVLAVIIIIFSYISLGSTCFFMLAEYVHESIEATSYLDSGTCVLGCFSVSYVGFRTWPIFSRRILYGVLVYVCGVHKANRKDAVTSPC